MAGGVEPTPLDLPPLRLETFDPTRLKLEYDGKTDILYALPPTPSPATSIDVTEEVWLRVDPVTGDIVGFEIDDFRLVFLKKHPQVAAAWEQVRPKAADGVAFFLTVLFEFVRSLLSPQSEQPRLQLGHR